MADLQKIKDRIHKMVPELVLLTIAQKDELYEKIEAMNEDQLLRTEAVLRKSWDEQRERLRVTFQKDPAFSLKFAVFQEGETKKMYVQAINVKGREVMQNIIKQKSTWPLQNKPKN